MLLPKCKFDFATPSYWDTFFRNKRENFEWYGDYHHLSKLLHKYITVKDKLLVIGSGNSKLSYCLYKNGIKDNTNIDISDVVVSKMQTKYANLEGLQFIKMDALDLQFEEKTFSVVLDKGTLDALCHDDSETTIKTVNQMFSQVEKVLKSCGRYICISLLQNYVFVSLLTWFNKLSSYNWVIRIHRCVEAEKATRNEISEGSLVFPVFMVVCTKFQKSNNENVPILEVTLGDESHKLRRCKTIEEVMEEVKSVQRYSFAEHMLKSGKRINEDLFFEFYSPLDAHNPRYVIYLTDQPNCRIYNFKYAVFIVPQGRENEWLFYSSEGRQQLTKLTQSARLAVIHCNRYHTYQSKDVIQSELNSFLVTLAPKNCHLDLLNKKVPYLSFGEDLGQRTVLFQGISDFNGEYAVEDVKIENEIFRRLIFLNNQNIIQSEAKLKQVEINGQTKLDLDFTYLCSKHHALMLTGFGIYNLIAEKSNEHHILILGLGGGSLPLFIKNNIRLTKSCYLDVVDIDPEMKKVATDWFFLKDSKKSKSNFNLNIIIEDGISFIISKAENNQGCYNIIIFDINSADSQSGLSCPSPQFVEQDFLEKLKQCMNQESLFILNLVTRSERVKANFEKTFKNTFPVIYSIKVPEEVNIIYFAFKCEQFASAFDAKLKSSNSDIVINKMMSIVFKSKKVFTNLVNTKYIKDHLVGL